MKSLRDEQVNKSMANPGVTNGREEQCQPKVDYTYGVFSGSRMLQRT